LQTNLKWASNQHQVSWTVKLQALPHPSLQKREQAIVGKEVLELGTGLLVSGDVP